MPPYSHGIQLPHGGKGVSWVEHRADMRSLNSILSKKAVKVRKRVAYHLRMDSRRLSNKDVAKAVIRKMGWVGSTSGMTHAEVVLRYWSEVMGGVSHGSFQSCAPKTQPKRKREALEFYNSWEWKKLRFEVLKAYGAVCMLCHSTERIVVDHIKPRSKFPDLELSFENMQVLCDSCNRGKSNDDYTDFRPVKPEPELIGDEAEHMRSIRGTSH